MDKILNYKRKKIMNTRIKRYAKLREQINQEIQMIKLKNENNQKVLFYQKKLAKIDSSIFDKVMQKSESYFPNFTSLLQVKKISKNRDWLKDKNEINKWLEVINEVWNEEKRNPKTLDEYSPQSSSEAFVFKKLSHWKKKKNENKNIFVQMIQSKENITKSVAKSKVKNINHFELLDVVSKVNNKIQNYDQKIDFLIKSKKRRTKWIFWINLFFFCVLFTCLIIILTN